jgi:hypothetical protein
MNAAPVAADAANAAAMAVLTSASGLVGCNVGAGGERTTP